MSEAEHPVAQRSGVSPIFTRLGTTPATLSGWFVVCYL